LNLPLGRIHRLAQSTPSIAVAGKAAARDDRPAPLTLAVR